MSKRVFAVVGVMLMTTALALASASAFSLWGSEQKAPRSLPNSTGCAGPARSLLTSTAKACPRSGWGTRTGAPGKGRSDYILRSAGQARDADCGQRQRGTEGQGLRL